MGSAVPDWIALRPALCGVRTAAQALDLAPMHLLHAGPPLQDPTRPPPVLVSAIVMTCLHEGWAADETAAERLIADGTLTLSPAQDRGCVTPLAAVVSAGTPMFEVRDPALASAALHAPVSTVRGTDTRMGQRDPQLLSRLQRRDRVTAPALQACSAVAPLPLWPLAAAGLAQGDDLHANTAKANDALVDTLRRRGADALADDVQATPLFFFSRCGWPLAR